jgi:hypothetical protein
MGADGQQWDGPGGELPWDDGCTAAGDTGWQPGDLPLQSAWGECAGVEHTARGREPAWVARSGFAVCALGSHPGCQRRLQCHRWWPGQHRQQQLCHRWRGLTEHRQRPGCHRWRGRGQHRQRLYCHRWRGLKQHRQRLYCHRWRGPAQHRQRRSCHRWRGRLNTASRGGATVGGGGGNTASGDYATVGGGSSTPPAAILPPLAGAISNTASDWYATVGGGALNTASRLVPPLAGARATPPAASYSAIPGGYYLQVGDRSFGFSGQTSATQTDLSANSNIAAFVDVDLWLYSRDFTNASQLRFYEAQAHGSGANYVALRAPTSLSANTTYTLPASLTPTSTVGAGILQTDAFGNLSWLDPSALGGGGAGWALTGNSGTNPTTNFLGHHRCTAAGDTG